MDAELVYNPALRGYDLGPAHPLKPERFVLAIELMESYGLVPEGTADGNARGSAATPLRVVSAPAATDEDLLRVHSAQYVATVREAGEHPERFWPPRAGLGTPDDPLFEGMHEASALVAGAGVRAVSDAANAAGARAFSIAGGLHHAHRERAAGFCIYNDCAVGIAHLLAEEPDVRVAYVDIDAHHGDGVQEAFWNEERVLTVSVHETGMVLFPGTGFPSERGGPDAPGSAANIPLPPAATDACYRLAFEEGVAPAVRAFAPDVIVAQCGADAHHDDPLTTLGLTLPGHAWLVDAIVALAGELCAGRLAAFGGGGYGWEHVVPRAWTSLAARLADVQVPEKLPEEWRRRVREVAHVEPPEGLSEDGFETDPGVEALLLEQTRRVLAALNAETA